MGRSRAEEISYYIDTFNDKLSKLKIWWQRLPWETKLRAKGASSALALGLVYYIYLGSWTSLSDLNKGGLILFALASLAIFVSTVLEVFNLNTFKY